MSQEPGDTFVAYTDAQIIDATSTFFRAATYIFNQTLDDDLSERLSHAIMLLGSRDCFVRSGLHLDPMTVTRFKELIRKEFKVTEKCVDNDLTRLKDENIVEVRAGVLADGRTKIVALTEFGEILYRLIGTRMANLILATAELLIADGAVPANPREQIGEALKDFAAMVRRAKRTKP